MYSQTCVSPHLRTMTTCQQRPAWITSPLKLVQNCPLIFVQWPPCEQQPFFGVPSVDAVLRFDCTVKPVFNGQPWDSKKNWPLFESGHYTGADHEKLLYTLAGWGLGRLLVTGGRCSEVAVYTGFKCVFVKCVMSISVVKKSQRFSTIEL